MTPKILLITTCRWPATARLAMALVSAGCAVEAVCPPGHPVAKTRAPSRIHRYRGFAPLRSVGAALDAAQPDLVIPCDDLATIHLHDLYGHAVRAGADAAATRTLIENSLGEPSSFSVATARTNLIKVARELGIRVPPTAVVRTMDELTEWFGRNGLPAVLKTDRTYGGRGVRVVNTLDEAKRGLRALSPPPSAARAIKRALVNGDSSYVRPCLSRTWAVVNAQRFVAGQDATSAVACWQGKVLASIAGIALRTLGRNGPSSVVRVIDNREMSVAVEKIVAQLRLSGILGFDFIVEEETGDAYLIEMNPRATQMAHLQLGVGRDLPAAVRAIASGDQIHKTPSVTPKDVIAFFPQEWLRDPQSPFLNEAYHDVPWDEPELLRACLEETRIVKAWSAIASKMLSTRRMLEEKIASLR